MIHYPLIVVGAGPAGFCAAVAAARMGVKTLLVEQYGMLGGAMTVGGVPYPMCFAAGGRQVIAGVGWELIERLLRGGWARGRGERPYGCVDLDIAMTACEMDAMAQEAGVALLLHCKLCEVRAQGEQILEARFAAPEGLISLKADAWIDATGDGSLAYLAGAAFEMGDARTHEVQPGSLGFWMDGYDLHAMQEETLQEAFQRGRKTGKLIAGDYYGESVWPVLDLFAGHGLNKNHVDIPDVTAHSRTKAALEGRERIARVLQWARESLPEARGIYGAAICPEAWPRESRRILGMSYVTAEDYRQARRYADGICHSYYPMDVHKKPADGAPAFELETHTLSPDRVPSIPLGALVARDFSHLLVAGRCISGDRMAQSAYRVQATCMGMGHAAGVAAAVRLAFPGDMREVDAQAVRQALRAQKAVVPD